MVRGIFIAGICCIINLVMYTKCIYEYNHPPPIMNTFRWAILGVTARWVEKEIPHPTYCQIVKQLEDAQTRMNEGKESHSSNITRVIDQGLPLLNHTSVVEGMFHSPSLAANLKTWTKEGLDQMKMFLVQLG